ncbi:MAG: eCIS core domain-containing protein, partial [Boseongicola sp.]
MAREGAAKTKSHASGEARATKPKASGRPKAIESDTSIPSADNQALQSLLSNRMGSGPKVHEGRTADSILSGVGASGAAVGQNILLSRSLNGAARQSVLRHEMRHVDQVGGRDVDVSRPITLGARGDAWERGASGTGSPGIGADPQVLRRNDDLMTSIDDSGVCEMEPEPTTDGEGTDAEGDDAGVCLDPTQIDVRPLSNSELIAKGVEVRGYFEDAEVCSDEITAWRQLNTEIEDERQRRVAAGYVFMSTARDAMPANLLELIPGDAPGVTQVFVADPEVAGGFADGNLNGVVMTVDQFNAYI